MLAVESAKTPDLHTSFKDSHQQHSVAAIQSSDLSRQLRFDIEIHIFPHGQKQTSNVNSVRKKCCPRHKVFREDCDGILLLPQYLLQTPAHLLIRHRLELLDGSSLLVPSSVSDPHAHYFLVCTLRSMQIAGHGNTRPNIRTSGHEQAGSQTTAEIRHICRWHNSASAPPTASNLNLVCRFLWHAPCIGAGVRQS